ncbi:TPA: sugar ABC transporter substrate-binding protein, partial [Candidatus Bipolaricaulota bacterium]|nr:sugar ABC transporter substrate-binding protein [Candidatus Bipolaricaulota bacterium]
MRKYLALFLIASLVAGPALAETLSVVSRVFSPPEEQRFIRDQIIPLFEAENPGVTVDFEILTDSEMLDKL